MFFSKFERNVAFQNSKLFPKFIKILSVFPRFVKNPILPSPKYSRKMSTCSDSTSSPGKLLETDDYIMCRNLDEKDDLIGNEAKLNSSVVFDEFKSYDSITEATDDWGRKIKAFLDDKAQELKKMQKPLYEEFYNSLNKAAASPSYMDNTGFKATPRVTCSERHRKWKKELDQELQRKREMRRQAGVGGKTSVPKDRALTRQRE